VGELGAKMPHRFAGVAAIGMVPDGFASLDEPLRSR
jgi:hypothetical protein